MAEPILLCAGCNVKYRAKRYQAGKAYKCPKCGQPLSATSSFTGSPPDGALDPQGNVEQIDDDSLVGQTIGQHRIVEKLGEGGMGTVYKAEHLALKRYSVLKILPLYMVKKLPDAVERFTREARAAAALSHPHIVAVYGVGEWKGRQYIEMEYVQGETLLRRVMRQSRLEVHEATEIVRDVARALAAAHAKNIVHRDIKPANIMITSEGMVKVMDFGLAKEVEAHDADLTTGGMLMGTPSYMSPEQCDGKELDGRADIYSLGTTYYCLLTGEVPFKGTSFVAILVMHKTQPVPDPRTLRSDLPPAVCNILEKALAKDRDARYQTCEEMLRDLDEVLAGHTGSVAHEAASAAETPIDESASDEPPIDEPPIDESPIDEPPVDEPPVDEPPVDEPPVDEPEEEPAGEHVGKEAASAEDGGDEGPVAPERRPPFLKLAVSVMVLALLTAGAVLGVGWRQGWYSRGGAGGASTKPQAHGGQGAGAAIGGSGATRNSDLPSSAADPAPVPPPPSDGRPAEGVLAPGLDTAFTAPTCDKDQHGNPAVRRDGSGSDSNTGWPYEIWLKQPWIEFVLVPAGQFVMGSPANETDRQDDEGPAHMVRITRPFYLGKYELTNAQYRGFRPRHDSRDYQGASLNAHNQPAVQVSWHDAVAYCKWLGERSGAAMRLPSEAEWEYACRAGAATPYYWGESLDPLYCNVGDKNASLEYRLAHFDDGYAVTAPVGRFRPNGLGLYEMLGNAMEWCLDGKRPYAPDAQTDPLGPDKGWRAMRGGSWGDYFPSLLRCASRRDRPPTERGPKRGLRLALLPVAPAPRPASRPDPAKGRPKPPPSPGQTRPGPKPSAPAPQPPAPAPKPVYKLPAECETAFMAPTGDSDQHGKPVVSRGGNTSDPKTRLPYEIWLREPRMEFVLVPQGEFSMGSPEHEDGHKSDEGPVHRVRITRPFYMGKYEVTNGQYRCLKPGHDSKKHQDLSLNREYQPAASLSWRDARAFCKWLRERSGVHIRMPTEAEWEYACRAGTQTKYYWGAQPDRLYGNFAGEDDASERGHATAVDGYPVSARVGRFRPNALGLYDMLGNVWEWCLDGKRSYSSALVADPRGPVAGHHVLRGGSWLDRAGACSAAGRYVIDPEYSWFCSGVRVCFVLGTAP